MDTVQIKGHMARIRELVKNADKPGTGPEAAQLAFNLLEDFLLDHKRQTVILEELLVEAQHKRDR